MHDASGRSIAGSVETARSMVRAARSAPEPSSSASDVPTDRCDVAVVGAGFAGMYMRYRIRQLGLTVRVFETGNGVGGTWYWNRYPGARVDGGSLSYSYGFDDDLQQEWSWSELFASQAELLAYANHVADRFDLRKDIQFSTTVKSARWCDSAKRWLVETDRGDRVSAKYFITAVGCLSAANIPPFAGLDQFMGRYYHTARWPEDEVELAGKLIGVIGTGSTGMQIIPTIAEKAKHLYVFQRTPHYAIPSNNEPMDIGVPLKAWRHRFCGSAQYGLAFLRPLPGGAGCGLPASPAPRGRRGLRGQGRPAGRCAAPWRPEGRPRILSGRKKDCGGAAASFSRPAQRARRGHAASFPASDRS